MFDARKTIDFTCWKSLTRRNFEGLYPFNLKLPPRSSLVGGSRGEGGSSETNTLVGSVEDRVEALEESETVDEVETLARVGAKVIDNAVDGSGNTTDISIEGSGPDLSIGGQAEGGLWSKKLVKKKMPERDHLTEKRTYAVSDKVQSLEVRELGRRKAD